MPAFKDSMSDAQIAELVSFLRKQFAPDKPAWTEVSSAVNRVRQRAF
jgi:nicotinate dehydrogenase subunit B